jgi:hypothetical protein
VALGAIQLHACASAYPEAKAVGASPPLTQAPQSTPTPRYRAAGSRGSVSLCVTPTLLASVTERPLRNVDRLGKQNEKLTSQESLKEVNPLPQVFFNDLCTIKRCTLYTPNSFTARI